ncbi:MAG: hypothetical protein KGL39_41835 [Patescibacteria group bacterium]|nr:hypothetical protein [Patescibacteria group bacterium]
MNLSRPAILALRYVHESEVFDRTVCTGPIREDGIMPASSWEAGRCNAFADRLKRDLGSPWDSDFREWFRQECREWERVPHEERERIYQRVRADEDAEAAAEGRRSLFAPPVRAVFAPAARRRWTW